MKKKSLWSLLLLFLCIIHVMFSFGSGRGENNRKRGRKIQDADIAFAKLYSFTFDVLNSGYPGTERARHL